MHVHVIAGCSSWQTLCIDELPPACMAADVCATWVGGACALLVSEELGLCFDSVYKSALPSAAS